MDPVDEQEAAAAGSGKEPEKTKGGKGGKGGKGRKAKRKREDEEDDGTPETWEEQSEEDGDGDGAAVPESIKNYVKTMLDEHQTVKAQVEQLKAANKLLEDKVRDFKNADEHKKLRYDVDLATLKKKVAQLPSDGDISGYLFETSLGTTYYISGENVSSCYSQAMEGFKVEKSKVVPNNRVIPDQFLKKAVNQVGSAAESEMSRDEKQYEAMIAEITRSNYQHYPL